MSSLEKFVGGMLGAALGDAAGRPFEGSAPVPAEQVEQTVSQLPILTVTDDTIMALDVARSLAEKGCVDPDDLIQRFVRSYNPARGYGLTTASVLAEVRGGASWREAAFKVFKEGSFGNGAAMRVHPVGLFYCHDARALDEAAEKSSLVTHAHPLAVEGAKLQAKAVALAAITDPSDFDGFKFLRALREDSWSEPYAEKLEKVEKFLERGASGEEIISELGNGSEATNSVPTAIYVFLANAGDFEKTVLTAVSLGGDADTIANMSGAIAGALLGSGSIPAKWIEKIELAEEVERVARDLFFSHARMVLGGRCEVCMGEESVGVYRLDESAGYDVSNLILLCRDCRREMEKEKEEFFAKPRKHGKYRAVYRKAHKRA